ncbi:MAG: ATP-dependent RecD-like DNA helicase [Erysipelothrix sp.]|nr:ATP-dependent RecD-like DNA helicase [Erysipelothrix sp.]
MQNKEKITGQFERVIFQNNENYYTVAFFVLDNMISDQIIAVGHIQDLDYDSQYELLGEYVEHKKYGIQFDYIKYTKVLPTDKNALIKFLSSGIFPGIGTKTAEKIFDELGNDLVNLIKANPKLIDTINLTETQANSLYNGILNNEGNFEQLVAYFSSYGLSINMIIRIDAAYGKEAIEVVEENPYRLMEDISGIGFKTADKLALKMNFDQDSIHKKEAIIIQSVLEHGNNTGDSYINKTDLLGVYLKYGYDEESFEGALVNTLMRRVLVMESENIYHHTQYDSEKNIATVLNIFPQNKLATVSENKIDEYLNVIEKEIGITYDQSQKSAIKKFLEADLSILTGGPGTGKTTIIRAMVLMYQHLFPNISIALCAPTGRAAKRLSELTNSDAFTIHSLLKWDLENNTFGMNSDNLLPYDILIIDEFSMVDQWLFSKLLLAAQNVKKILIVGDENQLPSVLPGAVLRDLISSELFPVERLKKIYRQKVGSSVIYLADKINKGNYDQIVFEDEVRFFQADSSQVDEAILQIVQNYLDAGYDIDDIQVLAPMYRNSSGINILNNKIQQVFNPKAGDKKEFKYGYRLFREGDKLLQLKNQIDEQVFNGDIGRLIEIDDSDPFKVYLHVDFEGNLVTYTGESLSYLTHAYCVSIHKSQGSEYPIVIMPIVRSSIFMLRKRLLYTAITRSKRNLILVGSQDLFLERVQKDEQYERKTTLIANLNQFSDNFDF